MSGTDSAGQQKVRLEGMINHVLRRRIVRCERQLIPKALRPPTDASAQQKAGPAGSAGGSAGAASTPAVPAPNAVFAVPQAHAMQQYPGAMAPPQYAGAGYPVWQMGPMGALPVVAGWVFQPQLQHMHGWVWQANMGGGYVPVQQSTAQAEVKLQDTSSVQASLEASPEACEPAPVATAEPTAATSAEPLIVRRPSLGGVRRARSLFGD